MASANNPLQSLHPHPTEKKEYEAKRASATERAANLYLSQRRSGNAKASVKECCDIAASETGFPRPAETSVRRLLPKLMTDAEKEEKRAANAKADRRADATKAAADMYRKENGDGPGGEVTVSVTRCCDLVEPQFGIRPAETTVRRMLRTMYEKEGIEPRKRKAGGADDALPPVLDCGLVSPAMASPAASGVTSPGEGVDGKPEAKKKKRKKAVRKPRNEVDHAALQQQDMAVLAAAVGLPPLPEPDLDVVHV